MKSLIVSLVIVFVSVFVYADSLINAKIANKDRERISPANSKFLVEMTDARMMDQQEGQLAFEKGTTAEVRTYGKQMVVDQDMLLKEIDGLAKTSFIHLPEKISDEKLTALNDLKKLNGRDFDKKFLTMIRRDHERDVKAFRNVKSDAYPEDKAVLQFSSKRLPLIEAHLDGAKKIQKNY